MSHRPRAAGGQAEGPPLRPSPSITSAKLLALALFAGLVINGWLAANLMSVRALAGARPGPGCPVSAFHEHAETGLVLGGDSDTAVPVARDSAG